MNQFTFNGTTWELASTIDAGTSSVIEFPDYLPASLAVFAEGASASCTVELTLSSQAALKQGTARWVAAGIGSNGVVANGKDATDIPAPIRAVRITNNGSVAVYVEGMQ